MTCLLLVFGIFVYFNFRATLFAGTDDLLELKAQGIVEYIGAYWQAEKRKWLERGEAPTVFLKLNSSNFVAVAERWVDEIPEDPALADMAVAIFMPDGQLVAASSKNFYSNPFPKVIFADISHDKGRFTTVEQEISGRPVMAFRILTTPVWEGRSLAGILQVAKPLTFVQESLEKLKVELLLFWPVAVLVVALTGWFLSRLILTPLDRIIYATRQISGERLSTRVHTPDARGEVRELADTFNDMLDKLEKAFATQKQLTQDVSHELRTPLTILKGEIEVALKKLRSPQEYQAILTSNLEEIDRLNSMTESLLVLARLDSGQLSLDRHPVSLSSFLEDIAEALSALARQKKITLRTEEVSQAIIEADVMHLPRAVVKILENAIKYTPEYGTISISADQRQDAVVVRITDTGVGIEPSQLPFVFDRFYRADTSRSGSGFGLGLSIARSIIEAHGGKIEVSSTPGQGTTFLITLPAVHS